MKTAMYIPDKNANGNDFLYCDGAIVSRDADILSAVDFPKGRHIFRSEHLNIHSHWNRIYIKTFLSDDSRDIKNRLVPVLFTTKTTNPTHAFEVFVECLKIYGDKVNKNVLEDLKKALKQELYKKLGIALGIIAIPTLLYQLPRSRIF